MTNLKELRPYVKYSFKEENGQGLLSVSFKKNVVFLIKKDSRKEAFSFIKTDEERILRGIFKAVKPNLA